ncbi:hypothetical protein L211DRAFT_822346 [Terfezia boudieri ATCC MYA-4762]|uniref:Uncharacterized protein n=1 Tax=Terfezia boudieri ATCC MYA-4762 TaxID=1051890 RepID=A0A3N4LRM9_9PEZI|nr:hypothetical protein L211DRAFT_822346 [Terfezia boudieri ATCC MYA-4762]
MANRKSDAERAMNEGMKGGAVNYDAGEAVPEALGGAKDYSRNIASKIGRSIPTTSARETGGSTERGTEMLDDTISSARHETSSTLQNILGNPTTRSSGETGPTEDHILPRDHHGGRNPLKAFTSKGVVGSQFNPEGPIGSIPQAVGGPFDKEGIVGKQFTSEGVIGGTVDKLLGEKNPKDPLGRQK